MKALIVYAHPNVSEEGYSSFTLKEMTSALAKAGIEHEVIDLYKLNYDPVLHEDELYTVGHRNVTQQNRDFQEKIRNADSLVFIYPVWWGDTPAILKGFFDKVFSGGFAYSHEKGGLLTGKKSAVMITMNSEDKFPGKMMKEYILETCSIETKVFQIGNAHHLDDSRKAQIQANVKKAVRFLKKKKEETSAPQPAQTAQEPAQQSQQQNQPAP